MPYNICSLSAFVVDVQHTHSNNGIFARSVTSFIFTVFTPHNNRDNWKTIRTKFGNNFLATYTDSFKTDYRVGSKVYEIRPKLKLVFKKIAI